MTKNLEDYPIFDAHFHPICKEATWDDLDLIADGMWGVNTLQRKRMRPFLDAASKKISISDYIQLMNQFHIEKAIIVSLNVKSAYGFVLIRNEDITDFVSRYPDRFIGFAGIDLLGEEPLEDLIYAIESLELSGVKLAPPVQKCDISDPQYNKIWKKLVDYDIPLWTHTGHQISTQGSIAKYGHPLLVDEIALRFPELKIIMGHMGFPWHWDAWSVVIRHRNVYIDVSAHPELYNHFPWDAYSNYQAENKVLFASDHPLCHWNQITPAIKSLPLSKSYLKKILYQNAKNLFF